MGPAAGDLGAPIPGASMVRRNGRVWVPGIKTAAQAEENAGAMQHGPLTAAQIAEIDSILGR